MNHLQQQAKLERILIKMDQNMLMRVKLNISMKTKNQCWLDSIMRYLRMCFRSIKRSRSLLQMEILSRKKLLQQRMQKIKRRMRKNRKKRRQKELKKRLIESKTKKSYLENNENNKDGFKLLNSRLWWRDLIL